MKKIGTKLAILAAMFMAAMTFAGPVAAQYEGWHDEGYTTYTWTYQPPGQGGGTSSFRCYGDIVHIPTVSSTGLWEAHVDVSGDCWRKPGVYPWEAVTTDDYQVGAYVHVYYGPGWEFTSYPEFSGPGQSTFAMYGNLWPAWQGADVDVVVRVCNVYANPIECGPAKTIE